MIAYTEQEIQDLYRSIMEAQSELLGRAPRSKTNSSYYTSDDGLNKVLGVLYHYQSLVEQIHGEMGNDKAIFLIADQEVRSSK